MKKGEGLKDFPDKVISSLLRDDYQLLRAIHSRLGFTLHADAETSVGAVTRLDRDQFKSLCHATVSQFNESDIEKTVRILMEATTQRLVLVSTPESEAYVSFDIRQLQEFFASE